MAAGMVIVGSVIVVATVWDQVSGLRSLDTRNAIEAFLAEPFADGLGLDVESTIRLLHISAMVTAGLATASAVLGWHVLQRNLAARLALSILAVPLFVLGITSGGFMSSLVAASVAMLWLSPAREWFRTGSWTPPAPAAAARRSTNPQTFGGPAPGAPAAGEPSADARPADTPFGQTPAAAAELATSPSRPKAAASLHDRPTALVAAFVVTVVAAGLVLVTVGFAVLVVAFSPDLMMQEVQRQRPEVLDGVTLSEVRTATFVMGALCLSWCAVALTFAGFAMGGRGWAGNGLAVTAAASAGACLLMGFYSPVAIVPALAALATVVLLRRGEVRDWFARPRP